jgi:WD40 repeat protein
VDERGQLAVAFNDGYVQRYTLADGRPVPRSNATIGETGWAPQFSPDGVYLAAAESGGVARVWRTDDREPTCPRLRHGGSVTALRVFALGRRLAVGVGDGTVRVWDLAVDQRPVLQIRTNFPGDHKNIDLRFLPDGRFALTGGGTQWTASPDQLLGRRCTGFTSPAFTAQIDPAVKVTAVTPDGAQVFSGTDKKELRVSGDDRSAGAGLLRHDKKLVLQVQPSADGRYVATVDAPGDDPMSRFVGNAQVWDVTTRKRVFGPVGPDLTDGAITGVAVHARPGCVALARMLPGSQSRVHVYDLATGRPSGSPLPIGPQLVCQQLRFSPDGQHLAVAAESLLGSRGEITVWDVGTGHAVVPAMRLSERPEDADFSPNGQRLAVATGHRALVFDLAGNHPPAELPHPKEVQFARFGRDGSVLLTAAGEQVFLWDPAARSLIRPPLRHDGWVAAAAISPDGRHVAAFGGGLLMDWQVAGGQLDPDATTRLGRLLSCTAVGRDELLPAAADQLVADWAELRRTHPSELRPAADVVAEWHVSQWHATVSARRFGPAGRHLEATWPTLIDDLNRLMTGACYLAIDDRAGVRRTFTQLAQLADADPSPRLLTRAIEIGLHDPEALTSAEQRRAIAFGAKLSKPGSQRDGYEILARALALARAGRLEAAERDVAEAQKANDKIVQGRANAQLAVIRRLQGRSAEAQKLADAAAVELARRESEWPTEWDSAIFLRRLIAEARRPVPKSIP